MDAAAAIRIQSMARVRMSRRVAATRTVLKTKRDHFVSLLAPLYEELYDLPAAKDEEQHTRLLHRLIIKNVVGVDGDSLTDVAVESMEALVHELVERLEVLGVVRPQDLLPQLEHRPKRRLPLTHVGHARCHVGHRLQDVGMLRAEHLRP